jgi:hypothetical protein
MAMLVAPVVAQLSVLLVPDGTLAGLAVKEVIAGAVPSPEPEPIEGPEMQPVTPRLANRANTSPQSFSPEEMSPRELTLRIRNESGEFIHDPSIAVGRTAE